MTLSYLTFRLTIQLLTKGEDFEGFEQYGFDRDLTDNMKQKQVKLKRKSNIGSKWLKLGLMALWMNAFVDLAGGNYIEKTDLLNDINANCLDWKILVRTKAECVKYLKCDEIIKAKCRASGEMEKPPCQQIL